MDWRIRNIKLAANPNRGADAIQAWVVVEDSNGIHAGTFHVVDPALVERLPKIGETLQFTSTRGNAGR